MRYRFYIVLIFTLLLTTSMLYAQSPKISLYSGVYGQSLDLAVNDQEKVVSGYFNAIGDSASGSKKPSWRCQFYFSGRLQEDGNAKITASLVGLMEKGESMSTNGTISPESTGEDAVIMKLDKIFPTCSGVKALVSTESLPRDLPGLSSWVEVRIVASKRSYFYSTADIKDHRKAYVTCGDIVMVTAKDKTTNRVKVEYIGENNTTTGWLLQTDLLKIGEAFTCPK